jgi:hypothetical protein
MNPESNVLKVPVAGLLTWLLPGAGHLYIGERVRGIILMAAIAVTFWGGIAIGGVKNTVNPTQRSLWFAAQICAGGHTLATLGISRLVDDPPASNPSLRIGYGPSEEIPVVYTAICGMLNILIIFDVLVRAEKGLAAQGGATLHRGTG